MRRGRKYEIIQLDCCDHSVRFAVEFRLRRKGATGGIIRRSRRNRQAQWVIGMSQCNLGEPWRVQMNQDIKQAAEKHPEIKMVFKDAQNDSLKQRSQVEEYISAGVDLIIVSPKEAAPLTPPIAAAYDKGIPVIVLDRRVMGDRYTCFIGADNKKIGKAAGEWIVEKLGGKGRSSN